MAAMDAFEDDDDCLCEWPESCGGLGVVQCEGCGGDQCICECGGECECFGCEDCDREDVNEDLE
jgi:hypothetical protein